MDGLYSAANPSGFNAPSLPVGLVVRSWTAHLLPYIEQAALFNQLPTAGIGLLPPAGTYQAATPAVYRCPADPRGAMTGKYTEGSRTLESGLGSYVGVGGTDRYAARWPRCDGVLYWRSRVAVGGITDGTSNTLMVGERPPVHRYGPDSYGFWVSGNFPAVPAYDWGGYGAYYYEPHHVQYTATAAGTPADYEADGTLCSFPVVYRRGAVDNACDLNHFWSFHPSGANFALADGSVRFVPYSAAKVLVALGTRAGGEVVGDD